MTVLRRGGSGPRGRPAARATTGGLAQTAIAKRGEFWRPAERKSAGAPASVAVRTGEFSPRQGTSRLTRTFVGVKQSREDTQATGSNKTIVMGIVERDGRLRAGRIEDTTMVTLVAHVIHNFKPGTTVSTDGWGGYNKLQAKGYVH